MSTSISLNMPKYLRKCLNKLFWLCYSSKYAWTSYIFDRLLKLSRILNKPGFWICHSCICKSYAEFQIFLTMSPYASISLNISEYCWMSLDMPENAWINCSGYSRVLNVPWFSYNMMIIVTNVIMLQFLSAQFIYTGALLPFCFLTWVRK